MIQPIEQFLRERKVEYYPKTEMNQTIFVIEKIPETNNYIELGRVVLNRLIVNKTDILFEFLDDDGREETYAFKDVPSALHLLSMLILHNIERKELERLLEKPTKHTDFLYFSKK